MALQPVSSVTPISTKSIAFSGQKREVDEPYQEPSSRNTGVLKAVPVAVLIAMSPLNKVNAVNPPEDVSGVNDIELVEQSPVGKPKLIKHDHFSTTGDPDGVVYDVKFYSTDGNDSNFEFVDIKRSLGKNLIHRCMAKTVLIKDEVNPDGGQEYTLIKGIPLPEDNDGFKLGNRRVYTLEEPNSNVFADYIRKVVASEANNDAIKIGKPAYAAYYANGLKYFDEVKKIFPQE